MSIDTNPIRDGHARLAELISGLTDTQARAASALPGWSRGHVLTHIATLARAMTRQVEYALAGKKIEVYDGGGEGRAAAIEAGSGRPARALVDDVVRSSAELETAWAALGPADWDRPIEYRAGTVTDTVLCRWREVEIHTADLDLGYRPSDWTPEFCAHVIDFLAPRVPPGAALPAPVSPQDHAAWLAGRQEPAGFPRLLPWP